MGDAEGRCEVPSEAIVDIVDDRRGHPRRLPPAERPGRIPAALLGRTFTRHRRLDSRYECHASLHAEIWSEQTGAFHRTRTDAHAGPHREPPKRNRQFQARTLLGALHHLSRHHFHSHSGQILEQGRGRKGFPAHCRQALRSNQRAEEGRKGIAPTALRPHFAPG